MAHPELDTAQVVTTVQLPSASAVPLASMVSDNGAAVVYVGSTGTDFLDLSGELAAAGWRRDYSGINADGLPYDTYRRQ